MLGSVSRSDLDTLKARVDLVDLLAAHGVQAKPNGRGHKACCPFHSERSPSFSVDREKGLYHCFGCGKEGDHLTFLQDFKELAFPEAVKELQRFVGEMPASPSNDKPQPSEQPFPYDLVERVAEVWHQAFCERPEGLAYLESRGLKDKEMLRLFQVGYCDGEQLLAITTAEDREQLQRVGIINERGKEVFARCVVFPLKDRDGRVSGFYGRGTLPRAKLPHRFCAGAKTGFFYPEAARGAERVFLVEGVLDAMAFYQAGFRNVIALGGAQGFNDRLLEHLKHEKVAELVLCLDGDAAGQAAAEKLIAELEGFRVCNIALPDGQDPLSFLPGLSQAELASRFRSKPTPTPTPQPSPPGSACAAQKSYKKLSGGQGKLKIFVSLTNQEGQKAEATLDLYSNRGRKQEALLLSRRLGIDCQELDDWFLQILQELEARKEAQQVDGSSEVFAEVEVAPMTEEQREAALRFLQAPGLVEAILDHMEHLGYVGESEAKLLGYCVSVSRKLEKPLSAIIQSGSGAGKSYLAEMVQALAPPEDVVFYSRISPQALYHMPKHYLVHKLLRLEERAGGEACDYQIRSLQSQNKLVQAIVVKDPVTGKLSARENEVHGPIAYLETTTSLRLNPENTSRCFEIPLDESPEQTRRIHARQKVLRGLDAAELRLEEQGLQQLHHHAQRLLEPVWVVIPYVDLLTFPDRWLRTRRDHERFLCLIEVLAYLHQYQRPRKFHQGREYIEANADDYRWAYFLANRVLQNSLDELSRWARELLGFFEAQPKTSITRREAREILQWPDRRTRDALEELSNMEYLEVSRGASNIFYYQLSPLKEALCENVLGLITPLELARVWRA